MLIVLFAVHNVQAMELVKKDEYRWGTNKELAVAWYIFKNPEMISDFRAGKYEGKNYKVKAGYSKLKIEGYLEELEKQKAAIILQEFTSGSSALPELMVKVWLMRDFDEQIEYEKLVKRRIHEFHKQINWSSGFSLSDKNKAETNITLCVKTLMNNGIALLNCINYLDPMYLNDEKKENAIKLDQNFGASISNAIDFLKSQRQCIRQAHKNNYLIYQFAKMQSDRFFHIGDTTNDAYPAFKTKFGMKDQFEQDLVLFMNNELINEKKEVINEGNFTIYFSNKYKDYVSGTFISQGGFHEGSLPMKDWDNKPLKITMALKDAQEEIKYFNKFIQSCSHLEISDLLNSLRSGNQEILRGKYNTKSEEVKSNLIIPSCAIFGLSETQLKFIKDLIISNNNYVYKEEDFMNWIDFIKVRSKNDTLIRFNDSLIKQWFKYPEVTRKTKRIAELKIDIESNPATFFDGIILNLPLLVNCLIPDLLLYYCRHTGSMVLNCFALSEFLGSVHIVAVMTCGLYFMGMKSNMECTSIYPCSSYGIGYYILPWLDGTFNSFVKLLKKFFGEDGVRTRIRQPGVFRFVSACSWILSLVGNKLFAFNKTLGLLTHCIRISICYAISRYLNYVHCDNPISRGYPCKDRMGNDYSTPYTIQHLKPLEKIA